MIFQIHIQNTFWTAGVMGSPLLVVYFEEVLHILVPPFFPFVSFLEESSCVSGLYTIKGFMVSSDDDKATAPVPHA